jgi:hypothetical protein
MPELSFLPDFVSTLVPSDWSDAGAFPPPPPDPPPPPPPPPDPNEGRMEPPDTSFLEFLHPEIFDPEPFVLPDISHLGLNGLPFLGVCSPYEPSNWQVNTLSFAVDGERSIPFSIPRDGKGPTSSVQTPIKDPRFLVDRTTKPGTGIAWDFTGLKDMLSKSGCTDAWQQHLLGVLKDMDFKINTATQLERLLQRDSTGFSPCSKSLAGWLKCISDVWSKAGNDPSTGALKFKIKCKKGITSGGQQVPAENDGNNNLNLDMDYIYQQSKNNKLPLDTYLESILIHELGHQCHGEDLDNKMLEMMLVGEDKRFNGMNTQAYDKVIQEDQSNGKDLPYVSGKLFMLNLCTGEVFCLFDGGAFDTAKPVFKFKNAYSNAAALLAKYNKKC